MPGTKAGQGPRYGGWGGPLGPEGLRHRQSEPLAERNTPLIEGIHVPNDTLDEHLVLVECDELAERRRIEPFEQQQRAWMVTGVSFVGIAARPGRVARRQRPGLGEAIGGRQILLLLSANTRAYRCRKSTLVRAVPWCRS